MPDALDSLRRRRRRAYERFDGLRSEIDRLLDVIGDGSGNVNDFARLEALVGERTSAAEECHRLEEEMLEALLKRWRAT